MNGQYVYWTDVLSPDPGQIGRANLDGSGANLDFVDLGDHSVPAGMAIDSQHLY